MPWKANFRLTLEGLLFHSVDCGAPAQRVVLVFGRIVFDFLAVEQKSCVVDRVLNVRKAQVIKRMSELSIYVCHPYPLI
ncbi:UNVERIFIED_CONTAM: hypothetical protein NCL1_03179 [Trichonephila clavipes]